MKVPKYIREALRKRTKAAEAWNKYDGIITDFINKHKIDVPAEDYCGGVEGIVNPRESEESVIRCIEAWDCRAENKEDEQ